MWGRLAHALAYLRRGLAVVPLRPRDKVPLVPWRRFQRERPSPLRVRRWLARWPEANLGVVTGAVSGLVVLDVDPRHGGDEALAALEAEFGPLPETVEVETGGGGRHLWFRHPGLAVPTRVGLRPGLDLRGEGALVVVPPSLHPNGRPYVFEVDHDLTDREPAPLPAWLFRLATGAGARTGRPMAHWRRLVVEGVDEGTRNTTLASLAGHLLRRGVDPAVVEELLQCWNRVRCRPPLPATEVRRVVVSILRTHRRRSGRTGREGPPAASGPHTMPRAAL